MIVTMYELLGMIKDGKAPKKIKCFNYNFIYTGDKRPQRFYKLLNQDNYLLKDFVYSLNTKVEIIEEEHKIPEKINWKEKESMAGYLTKDKQIEVIARRTEHLKKSINEILDYLEVNNEKTNK